MLVARWQQNDLPTKNSSQLKLIGCCAGRKLSTEKKKKTPNLVVYYIMLCTRGLERIAVIPI